MFADEAYARFNRPTLTIDGDLDGEHGTIFTHK